MTRAHAQVQDEAPTQLRTPELPFHHRHRAQDLSWMFAYAQPAPAGQENALVHDPKFLPFLKQNLKAPQSFWTAGDSLPNTVQDFLATPGAATLTDNRYLAITGCVAHFCPSRGLLWIDTGTSDPLVVFAAIDWIKDNRSTDQVDAAYSLWLFPSRNLSAPQLPPAFREALSSWTAQPSPGAQVLQNITRVFLVDPSGTPHTAAPATVGAHNTLPAETSDEQKAQS